MTLEQLVTSDADQERLDRVRTYFSTHRPEYTDIEFFAEGKTRAVYVATWQGIEKRMIKVDKAPQGPIATQVTSRGYGTENDKQNLMTIREKVPNSHSYDYGASSIEDCFDDYSLGTIVVEKAVLNEDGSIAPTLEERLQMIDGDETLKWQHKAKIKHDLAVKLVRNVHRLAREVGVYHRDIKPDNIVVYEKDGVLHPVLTDWGNAVPVTHESTPYQPTHGSRMFADPLVQIEGRAYDEGSVMYELGATLAYMFTGQTPFIVDATGDEVVVAQSNTGSSFYADGKLDKDGFWKAMHGFIVNKAQRNCEWLPVFDRVLSLEERPERLNFRQWFNDHQKHMRFASLDEMVKAVDNVDNPLTKRLQRHARVAGVGAAATLLLSAGVASIGYEVMQDIHQQALVEAQKDALLAEWTFDDGQQITTRDFRFTVEARSKSYYRGDIFWPSAVDGAAIDGFDVEPGQEFFLEYKAKTMPSDIGDLFDTWPNFPIQIHIPGVLYEEHYARFLKNNNNPIRHSFGYGGPQGQSITIPEDTLPGVYMMHVNLVTPAEGWEPRNSNHVLDDIVYEPNTVVSSVKVPIVVGDVETKVGITRVQAAAFDSAIVTYGVIDGPNMSGGDLPQLTYISNTVVDGRRTELNRSNYRGPQMRYHAIDVPDDVPSAIQELLIYDSEGTLIGSDYFPMAREHYADDRHGDPMFREVLVLPDKDFATKIDALARSVPRKLSTQYDVAHKR